MEYNRLSLVHQLGDEFILGMDVFDVDDIWDIIHNEKLEDLHKLADDVRAYIAENYKEGVTHTKEFIDRQVDLWILQYKWRYNEDKETSFLAKIKAEIERLYDGEAPKHDQQCNFDDGYFVGIDTIAQFLDTLESEKPMQEDLEEELKRWRHDHFDGERDERFSGEYLTRESQLDLAHHFAQWGAEHLK